MEFSEWAIYRNINIKFGKLREQGVSEEEILRRIEPYEAILHILNFRTPDRVKEEAYDKRPQMQDFPQPYSTVAKEDLTMDLICVWLLAHRNDEDFLFLMTCADEMLDCAQYITKPEFPMRLAELTVNTPKPDLLNEMAERRKEWSGRIDFEEFDELTKAYGMFEINSRGMWAKNNENWRRDHISESGVPFSRLKNTRKG